MHVAPFNPHGLGGGHCRRPCFTRGKLRHGRLRRVADAVGTLPGSCCQPASVPATDVRGQRSRPFGGHSVQPRDAWPAGPPEAAPTDGRGVEMPAPGPLALLWGASSLAPRSPQDGPRRHRAPAVLPVLAPLLLCLWNSRTEAHLEATSGDCRHRRSRSLCQAGVLRPSPSCLVSPPSRALSAAARRVRGVGGASGSLCLRVESSGVQGRGAKQGGGSGQASGWEGVGSEL